jgi:hypothetical protein
MSVRRGLLSTALVSLLMLSGCGGSSTAMRQHTPSPTATTALPTATVPEPTQAPVSAEVLAARKCSETQFGTTSGDFSLSAITEGPLLYLGHQLPPDWPTSQPHEVADAGASATKAPSFPNQSMAYMVTVCNTGTRAHSLQAVRLSVASLQLAAGTQQDVAKGCDTPYPTVSGGCGGACACTYNDFKATWSGSVSVGASTTATQTDTESHAGQNGSVWGTLPQTLLPGQGYTFRVSTPQLASGTYTFTIGVQTDTGVESSTPSFPIFFAPTAQYWSGLACLGNTTMTSQMVAGKLYLCPASH